MRSYSSEFVILIVIQAGTMTWLVVPRVHKEHAQLALVIVDKQSAYTNRFKCLTILSLSIL